MPDTSTVAAYRCVAALSAAALMLVGCSGDETATVADDAEERVPSPEDEAPAEGEAAVAEDDHAEPVTLRMASTIEPLDLFLPAVDNFVHQVGLTSGGALTVGVDYSFDTGLPDADQQVVEAVAAGEMDLAWVPTRVLDTFGVTTFQALHAPMLVDSVDLQVAIIDSEIAAEMLAGLDELGVTGLALLAGGLRSPFAVEAPLLGPDDYEGITFQSYRSDIQFEAVTALGADPTDLASDQRDAGLINGAIHGYEYQVRYAIVRSTFTFAPYVTLNVALWPETVVLIANPGRFAELADGETAWLHEAVAEAAARSAELVQVDADLLAEACGMGAQFADATPEDLSALRRAFEPAYAQLAEDANTAALIADIEALKESITVEPLAIPDGCAAN